MLKSNQKNQLIWLLLQLFFIYRCLFAVIIFGIFFHRKQLQQRNLIVSFPIIFFMNDDFN